MGLIFEKDVLRRQQAAIKRWYKRLQLGEWTITIRAVTEDELEAGPNRDGVVMANYIALPQYLDGSIWLNNESEPEDDDYVAFHELRHMHYARFKHVFAQAWDGRTRMTRDKALELLEDAIDEAIKRDYQVIAPLCEKNGKK